jgi:hypothetical protein
MTGVTCIYFNNNNEWFLSQFSKQNVLTPGRIKKQHPTTYFLQKQTSWAKTHADLK